MNILCLGARIVGIALAKELLSAFLNARFAGEARFKRRLNKVLRIESNTTQREENVAKGGTQ
jgi:ribose 5-phosphate isomerase B